MALCRLPSSRFILHSANALVLISVKVQEASKFPDIKIVNFDWLTASIESQIRADETQFEFGQTGPNEDGTKSSMGASPSKVSKSKGKKRARSPTPIEEDPSDVDEAGEKPYSDVDEAGEKPHSDVDEAGEQPPTKKHKDVQRAKSGSLLIPVDETCPLAGKNSDCALF